MTPELGFALIVALLYGPTAIWLAYRALRGNTGRLPERDGTASERPFSSPLAADQLEAKAQPDGSWVCEACRSLNRREANHCYRCRTKRGATSPLVPVELPVSDLVPVMAEGIARSRNEIAGTTAVLDPRIAPPASGIGESALEHVLPQAPTEGHAGVLVCPFLGFSNDPSTRYDFPDPRNTCHATSERHAKATSPRRFVPGMAGTRRAQPIEMAHQEARCLTAAHELCARYPAGVAVASNR